jgi:hypothetical protein
MSKDNLMDNTFPGNPVLDPTKNVVALFEAATKRQDDLRDANNERAYSEIRRVDAEVTHIKEMVVLRAEHQAEIRKLESNRLDAIRGVDVQAVSTAADRAQTAIKAVEAQTNTNAETLRNGLTNTATTIAQQLATIVAGITGRIEKLEQASYEGKGKQTMVDPMMVELVAEMRSLKESRDTGAGKSIGSVAMWGYVLGGCGFMFTVLTFGILVFKLLSK